MQTMSAAYACEPCGDVTQPACTETMLKDRCKDLAVSKFDPTTGMCEPLIAAGGYGEACGTNPSNPCKFSLKCLPTAADPNTKACLCDETSQWLQCGVGSVCAPARNSTPPTPPASTKFTQKCTTDQITNGGSACENNAYFCYDGTRGARNTCNPEQGYFEGVKECNRYCKVEK